MNPQNEKLKELFFKTDEEVSHPDYYTAGGIECIDYIRAKLTPEEFIGYCKGNALKYTTRMGHKDGNSITKDCKKAINYLNWIVEAEEDG